MAKARSDMCFTNKCNWIKFIILKGKDLSGSEKNKTTAVCSQRTTLKLCDSEILKVK